MTTKQQLHHHPCHQPQQFQPSPLDLLPTASKSAVNLDAVLVPPTLAAWQVDTSRTATLAMPGELYRFHAVTDAPCEQAFNRTRGARGELFPGLQQHLLLPHAPYVFNGRFEFAWRATLEAQGFLTLRLPADDPAHVRRLLLRLQAEFEVADLAALEQVDEPAHRQPMRFKRVIFGGAGGQGDSPAAAVEYAVPMPAARSFELIRQLQSIFFVAYHLVLDSAALLRASSPSLAIDPQKDYFRALMDLTNGSLVIHDNEARVGSLHQNAHWDMSNWMADHLLIDVPLLDVLPGGGPLEVWPGTHSASYEHTFVRFEELLIGGKLAAHRQYYRCFPEMEALVQLWPSALIHSRLGDIILRNPATWHRGTPNRAARTRHMLTLILPRMGTDAARNHARRAGALSVAEERHRRAARAAAGSMAGSSFQ
jgi:hypothetical protein